MIVILTYTSQTDDELPISGYCAVAVLYRIKKQKREKYFINRSANARVHRFTAQKKTKKNKQKSFVCTGRTASHVGILGQPEKGGECLAVTISF